jgi:HlyD family secretion protein
MRKITQLIMISSIVSMCAACDLRLTQSNDVTETAVAAAPMTSVIALGRLEPEGDVIKLSAANAEQSRVDQVLVKEGEYVKANQVIAILQGVNRLEADLKDALAQVKLREAELIRVQQGDAKKSDLAVQQAVIARLKAQMSAQTKQRQAAIASAYANLREAQMSFKRRQILASQGAISRADAELAKRNLDTAQAALAERKAELEQTVYTLKAEISQERLRLKELQEIRPIDVEIAKTRVEQAKIAVEQKKAELENSRVRSPITGQILRINTRVGEQVNISQGIVELARTNQMFAVAEVAEIDITKVTKGQRASISSNYGGFNGKLQGTVEYIGLQIGRRTLQESSDSPITDQNARSVAVKIRIDPEDSAKVANLTNMLVQVQLDLSTNKIASESF